MQLSTATWFFLFGERVAPRATKGVDVPGSGARVDWDGLVVAMWGATIHRMSLAGHVVMEPALRKARFLGRRRVPTVELRLRLPVPVMLSYERVVTEYLNRDPVTAYAFIAEAYHQAPGRLGTSMAEHQARSAGLGLEGSDTEWDRPRIQSLREEFRPIQHAWDAFSSEPVGRRLVVELHLGLKAGRAANAV